MARAIWTGAISFGLVSVPVGLYSATEDHTVHFNQFEKGTGDRIRYQRVNERTGKKVDYDHIVKGHDLGGGDYVIVTDADLEAVEPGRSRTIDITDFVDLDEIDPIFFQKTYYLAPQGKGSTKPYDLLRQAMSKSNRVGIATLVMRGKQYLVAIRAEDRILALETMFFADEVRDPASEFDQLPRARKFAARDLSMAQQLIESMAASWDPDNYRDTYQEQVTDMIERKHAGNEIVHKKPAPHDGKVIDLMDALRASVEASHAAREGKSAPAGKTAAKKPAAKKSAKKATAAKKAPARKTAAATKKKAS